MKRDMLRTKKFSPYRKGYPTFKLEMWDTHKTDWRGQTKIGYRFTERSEPGDVEVIFEGEDFAGSPMHADDSIETMRSLLSFLTLRPGDTDREYFESYSERQMEFCIQHAESLSIFCYE